MARAATHARDVLAYAQKNGILWQSSSIYGGIRGFYDFGPRGVELKRNISNEWCVCACMR